MGEYLFFHVGNVHYIKDGTHVDITTIIIIVLAVTVVVLIVLFLSIILIWKSCSKSKPTNTMPHATMDTDINMYASPAYGTHQVFTEPGLDHLYEPIDKYVHEEETTALQDATPTTAKDDETDVEGYLKMKSSSEVVDQAVTEGADVDGYLDMKSSPGVGNTEYYTNIDEQ